MNKLPKVLDDDLKRILSEKTNDNYLNLYVSSIVRGVVNLHNLLNNRISNIEELQERIIENKPISIIKAVLM